MSSGAGSFESIPLTTLGTVLWILMSGVAPAANQSGLVVIDCFTADAAEEDVSLLRALALTYHSRTLSRWTGAGIVTVNMGALHAQLTYPLRCLVAELL